MTSQSLPLSVPGPLLDLLQHTRATYLQLLDSALETQETGGTCFYASILLCALLNKFGDVRAVVRGGCGGFDGGYTDQAGVRHGHYWVEALDAQQCGWVFDITADQFGGPAVVALPLSLSVPRYVPGNQDLVDSHVRRESVHLGRD